MKKKFTKTRFAFAMAIFIAAFSACSKDDDNNNNPPNTIANVVATDAELSTLNAAVVKGNLTATLQSTGPFTLFAPTNDAFTDAGITSADLDAMSASAVNDLLTYHVIPADIFAADVPAGPNAKVITATGDSVFVTNNSNGVFINGVAVTEADLEATNGVVHKINNVLMPSGGNNIVEVAQADTTFTFLVAAVIRANVTALLSGSNILTVFAPTNNAFRAAGFATINDINNAPPATLAAILSYHVIAGRIFSSDLTNGQTPTTLAAKTVTIGVSGGSVTVKGSTNTTASNVIKANIMATNGVIHVIDQVLLP